MGPELNCWNNYNFSNFCHYIIFTVVIFSDNLVSTYYCTTASTHIVRIQAEEKAKVVAVVWGTELIEFLAALAILHQDDMKKGMNSSYSSYHPGAIHPVLHIFLVQLILLIKQSWCKITCAAKKLIYSSSQAAETTFASSSVCIFFYAPTGAFHLWSWLVFSHGQEGAGALYAGQAGRPAAAQSGWSYYLYIHRGVIGYTPAAAQPGWAYYLYSHRGVIGYTPASGQPG